MTLAMVKVLPEPVTPSSTCSLAPPRMPSTSCWMASGWSPSGRKGETRRKRSIGRSYRPDCDSTPVLWRLWCGLRERWRRGRLRHPRRRQAAELLESAGQGEELLAADLTALRVHRLHQPPLQALQGRRVHLPRLDVAGRRRESGLEALAVGRGDIRRQLGGDAALGLVQAPHQEILGLDHEEDAGDPE